MEVIDNNFTKIAEYFNENKIGVIPTDTLYGISCKTDNKELIEKIYEIKNRDLTKPLIVLISDISNLEWFDIKIDEKTKTTLKTLWPGKNTVIIPCPFEKFKHLHRGTNQIAFRVPNKPQLIELLKLTGPLTSTSVNPEGKFSAKSIEEAVNYFGDKIDFYVEDGILDNKASTIYKIENDQLTVVRN